MSRTTPSPLHLDDLAIPSGSRQHTHRSPSADSASRHRPASPTYNKQLPFDRPPNSPTQSYRPVSGMGPGQVRFGGIVAAIVGRVTRGVKRGNIPFLIVFVACLWIFFSALAGVGYVDPESITPDIAQLQEPEFVPGAPVYDATEDQLELQRKRLMEEQRELEAQWRKMKRPQDGAWMKKQRDDKAVRRQPQKVATPPPVQLYEDVVESKDEEALRKRDLEELD